MSVNESFSIPLYVHYCCVWDVLVRHHRFGTHCGWGLTARSRVSLFSLVPTKDTKLGSIRTHICTSDPTFGIVVHFISLIFLIFSHIQNRPHYDTQLSHDDIMFSICLRDAIYLMRTKKGEMPYRSGSYNALVSSTTLKGAKVCWKSCQGQLMGNRVQLNK